MCAGGVEGRKIVHPHDDHPTLWITRLFDLPFQNTVNPAPEDGSESSIKKMHRRNLAVPTVCCCRKCGHRVRPMISPWLGIPRIEDRRYDVVIDFDIATPFALSGYAYLRRTPWSFPTEG